MPRPFFQMPIPDSGLLLSLSPQNRGNPTGCLTATRPYRGAAHRITPSPLT